MCPTLLTCSFVTLDRKIKRSDLNVVISRPRLFHVFLCSYSGSAFPPKLLYRLSTGGRLVVNALMIS